MKCKSQGLIINQNYPCIRHRVILGRIYKALAQSKLRITKTIIAKQTSSSTARKFLALSMY